MRFVVALHVTDLSDDGMGIIDGRSVLGSVRPRSHSALLRTLALDPCVPISLQAFFLLATVLSLQASLPQLPHVVEPWVLERNLR
jgi:hypothetical protein